LEIYNENIKDLLGNTGKYLELFEDPHKGMIVSGITQHSASTAKEVMRLLQRGNRNRTTESTNANKHSSRSHAILQVNFLI
jgi:kinesin family protein 18/19